MFWVTLLILLAVPLVFSDAFWQVWFLWPLFIFGAVFCVLLIMKPIFQTYHRFQQWGDRKRLLELFCREYFLEPHVVSDRNYVITKHFLVEEQGTAGIYYWETLTSWSKGWISSKKGWVRQLRFSDGQVLEFVKGEEQTEEIFRYAAMYEESRGLKQRREAYEEYEKKNKPQEESLYSKLVTYFMVIVIAIIFSICIQN